MLRLLAISDIHGKIEAIKAFFSAIQKGNILFDAIIIAGDIGSPDDEYRLAKILKMFEDKNTKVFYIRGNWDVGNRDYISKNVLNLDKSGPIEINGFIIIGHGEIFDSYKVSRKDKKIILVTHYPPYGILDRGFKYTPYRRGSHTGLAEINKLVEIYNPIIHIFGHAHKSGGLALYLNGTYFINVARLDRFARNQKCIGNYTYIALNNNNKPQIKHYYINGVIKRCSRCGKKVMIPPSWNICKECMLKDELIVSQITLDPKITLQVITSNNKTVEIKKIPIPLKTIRNEIVLKEYMEDYAKEIVYKKILSKYKYSFFIPKELLPYVYRCPEDPKNYHQFIVRLFKCKHCKMLTNEKNETCLIFRTILKYKTEVAIGFSKEEIKKLLIIFLREKREVVDKKLINALINKKYDVVLVHLPVFLENKEPII